jgi:hypothetical protein
MNAQPTREKVRSAYSDTRAAIMAMLSLPVEVSSITMLLANTVEIRVTTYAHRVCYAVYATQNRPTALAAMSTAHYIGADPHFVCWLSAAIICGLDKLHDEILDLHATLASGGDGDTFGPTLTAAKEQNALLLALKATEIAEEPNELSLLLRFAETRTENDDFGRIPRELGADAPRATDAPKATNNAAADAAPKTKKKWKKRHPRTPMTTRCCDWCDRPYEVPTRMVKKGGRLTCSKACSYKARIITRAENKLKKSAENG